MTVAAVPPLPVRRRPRVGSGALRADLEQAALIEACDGTAAGADRGEVDHGHGDGQAPLELELGRRADRSRHDDADVGARAAHVECDDVGAAGRLGEVLARDQTARQAGKHEAHGLARRLPDRDLTAVGLEQEAWAAESRLREPARRGARRSVADESADVGVDDDRVAALVLAPDRRHLVRARHRDARKGVTEGVGEPLFVHGSEIGEEKVDRDRRRPRFCGIAGAHLADEPLDLGVVEFDPHLTVLSDPLRDTEAVAPPHVGRSASATGDRRATCGRCAG